MAQSAKPKHFLPYGRQHIDDSDIEAVTSALRGDYLTTGPKVAEFEDLFRNAVGAEHAIAVSNGTTALHLACIAGGIEEGTTAIVPTVTFLATANAVRYCGGNVIFADVDPETGMMTEETFLDALKKSDKNLKAVMPVHLGGRCADMESIGRIAKERGLKIIADTCHALGSEYKHGNTYPKAGSCQIEDLAAFSFHPVKTIAMGEGGAITTNDADMAKRMRRLRHHGMHMTPEKGLWSYEMPELGYNYREPDILCALGVSQLKKLDYFIQTRQKLVALYNENLKDASPFINVPVIPDCQVGWHLYAVRIDYKAAGTTRKDFMNTLKEKGVGTQVHYIPVHTQPYYANLYGDQTLPGANAYYEATLSLPLFPAMNETDVSYVCETLLETLNS